MTLFKAFAENISIQSFRVPQRLLLKMVNNTVSYAESIIKLRGLGKMVNSTVSISESLLRVRAIIRLANETISVQSFRERIRVLRKLVSESVGISEGFISRWVKLVNDTVSYTESIFRKRAIMPIVNEVVAITESVLTFAGYIRYANEVVSIVENLTKNLQYGLVKKSASVGTHARSKIGRLFDRTKNINLFKRGKGVKGV
jgi:hypothetical protein